MLLAKTSGGSAIAVNVRLAEGIVGFFVTPRGICERQFLILSFAAAFVAHVE